MSATLPKNNKNENRLTAEQTIILIRLVKKYKILWDTAHTDHRNRTVCDDYYSKIGKYFQIPGDDVRRKFRRLRDSYRQELKRLSDGKKAYTNMFYFDEMEFLKKQIEERRLKVKQLAQGNDDAERYPEDPYDELYTIVTDGCEPSNVEAHSTEGTSIVLERIKEDESDEEPSGDEEESDLVSGATDFKTDEFEVFAAYVASQLKEMDKLSALETMEELQRIILRRRISMLKRVREGNDVLEVEGRSSPKRSKGDEKGGIPAIDSR